MLFDDILTLLDANYEIRSAVLEKVYPKSVSVLLSAYDTSCTAIRKRGKAEIEWLKPAGMWLEAMCCPTALFSVYQRIQILITELLGL